LCWAAGGRYASGGPKWALSSQISMMELGQRGVVFSITTFPLALTPPPGPHLTNAPTHRSPHTHTRTHTHAHCDTRTHAHTHTLSPVQKQKLTHALSLSLTRLHGLQVTSWCLV